ncbi:hypothetical protein ABPG75_003964 [Micractinium tetrahymenae]
MTRQHDSPTGTVLCPSKAAPSKPSPPIIKSIDAAWSSAGAVRLDVTLAPVASDGWTPLAYFLRGSSPTGGNPIGPLRFTPDQVAAAVSIFPGPLQQGQRYNLFTSVQSTTSLATWPDLTSPDSAPDGPYDIPTGSLPKAPTIKSMHATWVPTQGFVRMDVVLAPGAATQGLKWEWFSLQANSTNGGPPIGMINSTTTTVTFFPTTVQQTFSYSFRATVTATSTTDSDWPDLVSPYSPPLYLTIPSGSVPEPPTINSITSSFVAGYNGVRLDVVLQAVQTKGLKIKSFTLWAISSTGGPKIGPNKYTPGQAITLYPTPQQLGKSYTFYAYTTAGSATPTAVPGPDTNSPDKNSSFSLPYFIQIPDASQIRVSFTSFLPGVTAASFYGPDQIKYLQTVLDEATAAGGSNLQQGGEAAPAGVIVATLVIFPGDQSEAAQRFVDSLRAGNAWLSRAYGQGATVNDVRVDSERAPDETKTSDSSTPVGAIVGGAIGGLALLVAAVLAFFLVRRRRQPRGAPSPSVSRRGSGRLSRGPSGWIASGQLPPQATADPASRGLLPFGSERSARLAREPAEGPEEGMAAGTPRFWAAAAPLGEGRLSPGSDPLLAFISTHLATARAALPQAAEAARPGLLRWEHLQLERPLGRGTAGKVYLGRLGPQPVAVKMLLSAGKGHGLQYC